MAIDSLIKKKLKRLLGLLSVLSMLLSACQDRSNPHPILPTAKRPGDLGPQKWKVRAQNLETDIVVGRLFWQASDPEGRISFQDSLVVQVQNLQGKRLARLRSHEATVQKPFDLVAVRDFLWECEDGSEIEGSDLFWHVNGPDDITVEGDLQLITDKGIVMGTDLVGDLLLSRYEVITVQSVVLWDQVAGGREGYRHAQ